MFTPPPTHIQVINFIVFFHIVIIQAILDGEQEVRDWLDYGAVSLSKALELIRPQSNIEWHPVSTIVNSTKNNTEQCVKPVDLK